MVDAKDWCFSAYKGLENDQRITTSSAAKVRLAALQVILEPLLQPRTRAKLFISFLYTMERKREIGTGTGHYPWLHQSHHNVASWSSILMSSIAHCC
jgi:hypothetical protein